MRPLFIIHVYILNSHHFTDKIYVLCTCKSKILVPKAREIMTMKNRSIMLLVYYLWHRCLYCAMRQHTIEQFIKKTLFLPIVFWKQIGCHPQCKRNDVQITLLKIDIHFIKLNWIALCNSTFPKRMELHLLPDASSLSVHILVHSKSLNIDCCNRY